MAIPRAKKPKTKKYESQQVDSAIELTTQTSFAIMVRTAQMVFDFDSDKLAEFCESYSALLQEVVDGRVSAQQFISDTNEMCGVDVAKIIRDLNVLDRKENK